MTRPQYGKANKAERDAYFTSQIQQRRDFLLQGFRTGKWGEGSEKQELELAIDTPSSPQEEKARQFQESVALAAQEFKDLEKYFEEQTNDYYASIRRAIVKWEEMGIFQLISFSRFCKSVLGFSENKLKSYSLQRATARIEEIGKFPIGTFSTASLDPLRGKALSLYAGGSRADRSGFNRENAERLRRTWETIKGLSQEEIPTALEIKEGVLLMQQRHPEWGIEPWKRKTAKMMKEKVEELEQQLQLGTATQKIQEIEKLREENRILKVDISEVRQKNKSQIEKLQEENKALKKELAELGSFNHRQKITIANYQAVSEKLKERVRELEQKNKALQERLENQPAPIPLSKAKAIQAADAIAASPLIPAQKLQAMMLLVTESPEIAEDFLARQLRRVS